LIKSSVPADLEWVLEDLKGRLETCLNASSGVCDIWYLETHSECKLLMDLIYTYSNNPFYKAKGLSSTPWN